MTDERVVVVRSILMPKTKLFHDAGSPGSDGSMDSRMAAAMYDGI